MEENEYFASNIYHDYFLRQKKTNKFSHMFRIFFVVSADPLKRLVLKKMRIACVGREVRIIISQAEESSGKCTSFSLL